AVEKTEESMVLAAALNADLVQAGHVAVHGLPLATAAERRRRRFGDSVQDGMDLGDDLSWKCAEEVESRRDPGRVVLRGALEEVDSPRLAVDLCHGPGSVTCRLRQW